MFSFLKKLKIRKNMKEISNSIDAYFDSLEKYKYLKNDEISSIPDDSLEDAVMTWMWQKFNEDWSNQYEVIISLPKPCQAIYSCRTVIDQINNGGFNQCFYNSSNQFVTLAQYGFHDIGAFNISKIVEKAIQIYYEIKPKLDLINDGSLEGFSKSFEENPLNDLDKQLYESEDYNRLGTLMISYIRIKSKYFGD